MQIVEVRLNSSGINRNYNIHVGPGMLEQTGALLTKAGFHGKAVIITDTRINSIYGSRLQHYLASESFKTSVLEIQTGEEQKSLDSAVKLYTELTDIHAERTTPILALGGGVIGDLGGFVAATYMRGVPLVQIPTTLLAQCDSSIGGKVAVNHGRLKNRIGTFYHPRLTISDTDTLKTLSERELSNGLAEVIKYGVILDAQFFNYFEKSIDKIRSLNSEIMETVVVKSSAIKAGIVQKDELDLGLRNILNYGHTVGHAIETVSGLTIWHGEAVAMGMVAEAKIARERGLLADSDFMRITNLIMAGGLPTEMPNLDNDSLIQAMQHDKKITQGQLRFALPQGIGAVHFDDQVPEEIIRQSMGSRV
jgi:3-dehydroquinate synthase